MSRFLRPTLASHPPYVPGEQPQDQQYIKLNTNESPYPPSPLTQSMVSREVDKLHLYPDPDCWELTKALALHFGLAPEQIICANGSDDLLSYAFLAFGDEQQGFAFPDITYGFYRVYGDFYAVPYRQIPLEADFRLNPADYYGLGCHILLANPNAQTGLALAVEQISAIAEQNLDHVVIVDEAYVDFGGESAVQLLPKHENILVIRTFSKSRSLAGARLGFAMGSPELIADLRQVKYSTNPYSVNRMSHAAGLGALADEEYYQDCCRKIMASREYTRDALLELGLDVLDSRANFLLAGSPSLSGAALYQALRRRGILVRHFSDARIRERVRISIGTQGQMETLVAAMKEILAEEAQK